MTEITETAASQNKTDQTMEIAGETITVRQYRYGESLEMAAVARPLLTAMRMMVSDDEETPPEALDTLIAEHAEIWLQMVARSCDRDVAWLKALPDDEAMNVQLAFWAVNAGFFTRRITFGAAFAAYAKQLRLSPTSGPEA